MNTKNRAVLRMPTKQNYGKEFGVTPLGHALDDNKVAGKYSKKFKNRNANFGFR
jgi:hypothetical protein